MANWLNNDFYRLIDWLLDWLSLVTLSTCSHNFPMINPVSAEWIHSVFYKAFALAGAESRATMGGYPQDWPGGLSWVQPQLRERQRARLADGTARQSTAYRSGLTPPAMVFRLRLACFSSPFPSFSSLHLRRLVWTINSLHFDVAVLLFCCCYFLSLQTGVWCVVILLLFPFTAGSSPRGGGVKVYILGYK